MITFKHLLNHTFGDQQLTTISKHTLSKALLSDSFWRFDLKYKSFEAISNENMSRFYRVSWPCDLVSAFTENTPSRPP